MILTIKDLEESVGQSLRDQAADKGHSIEVEAKNILKNALASTLDKFSAGNLTAESQQKSVCGSVRGIWKGRVTTAKIMELTRGE